MSETRRSSAKIVTLCECWSRDPPGALHFLRSLHMSRVIRTDNIWTPRDHCFVLLYHHGASHSSCQDYHHYQDYLGSQDSQLDETLTSCSRCIKIRIIKDLALYLLFLTSIVLSKTLDTKRKCIHMEVNE